MAPKRRFAPSAAFLAAHGGAAGSGGGSSGGGDIDIVVAGSGGSGSGRSGGRCTFVSLDDSGGGGGGGAGADAVSADAPAGGGGSLAVRLARGRETGKMLLGGGVLSGGGGAKVPRAALGDYDEAEVAALVEADGSDGGGSGGGGAKFWERAAVAVLDVSGNDLAEDDSAFAGGAEAFAGAARETLVRLDVSRNPRLAGLPSSLGGCTALARVRAAHCALVSLPKPLRDGTGDNGWAWANLAELDVSDNQLAALPAALWRLPRLARVDASGNRLTLDGLAAAATGDGDDDGDDDGGDRGFAVGASVTHLVLARNQLAGELPAGCFAAATGLVELDMSENQLEGVVDLSASTALTRVVLRRNRLSALPRLAPGASALSELGLGFNRIRTLEVEGAASAGAASLWELPALAVLELSSNQVSALPPAMGGCPLLRVLHLEDNNLGRVPPDLGRIVPLFDDGSLKLTGNPLRGMPAGLAQKSTREVMELLRQRLPKGTTFGGGGGGGGGGGAAAAAGAGAGGGGGGALSSLSPGERAAAEALGDVSVPDGSSTLDLTARKLGPRLPSRAVLQACAEGVPGGWAAVRTLVLSKNALEGIGAGATDDAAAAASLFEALFPGGLTTLVAMANRLTVVPPEVLSCKSLVEVDLTANRVRVLPAALLQLPRIRVVRLANNPTCTGMDDPDAVPSETLEALFLNDCAFTTDTIPSPARLAALPGLRHLELANNDLRPIPIELGRCTHLTTLTLHGNPGRNIPPGTLLKSTPEILAALALRLPQ